MTTPARTPESRRAVRQRDQLLAELERLVRAGWLGHSEPADTYVEIHRDDIRRAERLCVRVRRALAGK